MKLGVELMFMILTLQNRIYTANNVWILILIAEYMSSIIYLVCPKDLYHDTCTCSMNSTFGLANHIFYHILGVTNNSILLMSS